MSVIDRNEFNRFLTYCQAIGTVRFPDHQFLLSYVVDTAYGKGTIIAQPEQGTAYNVFVASDTLDPVIAQYRALRIDWSAVKDHLTQMVETHAPDRWAINMAKLSAVCTRDEQSSLNKFLHGFYVSPRDKNTVLLLASKL